MSKETLKKIGLFLLRLVPWSILVFYWVWAVGAAWHFTVAPMFVRMLFAVGIIAIPLIVSIRTRRFVYVSMATTGVIAFMGVCWQSMIPSNDRAWQEDLAKSPVITFKQDHILVENFLPFEGFTTQEFDLRQLERLWFGVEKFAGFDGGAHNFLTFEFANGKFVSVSVEARREVGEEYALLPALFRQFELIYLIGDESRIFGSRTDFSAPTYLFPLKSTLEERQSLLIDICERANDLNEQPEWYNILTNNCTNNLSWHASRITPRPISAYDLRVVLTGHADRLLYDIGMIDAEGELADIEQQCRMDVLAKETMIDNQVDSRFSTRIRSKNAVQ